MLVPSAWVLAQIFCCVVFANGADFVSFSRHCKMTCIAYCLLSVFFVMGRGSGDKGKTWMVRWAVHHSPLSEHRREENPARVREVLHQILGS